MLKKLKRIESLLLFLTILFLPTQLGKHFWPEFSFVYSLPIDYLSPTLYFWDILVILLTLSWIINRRSLNKKALNLFLFFIFTQSLSLIQASNIGAGIFRLEQYCIAGLFGLYVASCNWKDISGKIYLPLILAILFESVLAIAQVIKSGTLGFWILGERNFSINSPAIAKFNFYGFEILRPYATLPHPNVLAAFLLIGLLLIFKNRIKIIMIITTITIILTFSRTAILAGIFSIFLILRKKALILSFAVLLIISPILFTRFSSIFSFDNLTILRREELARQSWEIFLKNPFFGVGLNNFIPVLSSNLISGPNRFLQPVHNIFLLSLSETGLVGFIGFIYLISYPIFRLFKLYPKPLDNEVIASSAYTLNPLLLIWAVIIFLGLFDHYFLTLPQGYRLLFLVWGLTLSMLE